MALPLRLKSNAKEMTVQASDSIIHLKQISFAYPGSAPVLDGLDLTLFRGDRVALMAPNGSGKTTLIHVIMGLLKPTAGRIEIFGRHVATEKDFASIRRRIGLLFQDADDQLFSPTVIEDIAFGPLNLGKSKAEAIEISKKTLEYLGMSGYGDRITFKLSGGEKRMVSLATVLAMEPEFLLLDEPTTGLDEATRKVLISVLNRLEISHLSISHDRDFLNQVADTYCTMANGKIQRVV
jgi:cobalt/nickel transport system ATP-binding protein